MGKTVCVCICTRQRRKELIRLLDSIEKIILPVSVKLRVIIVENDTFSRVKNDIVQYSKNSRFPINYYLEKKQGISYARNRSVKEADNCDFCCFVDDDQIVKNDWLVELLKCQEEFSSDGVSGATPPIFEHEVPKYIASFHRDEPIGYGERVIQAATGCLMLKKEWLEKVDGPFDLRLNFTGGEDFYLTYQISAMGAVIRANHDAISYEIIPKDRSNLRYVIRRTIRVANTKLIVKSITHQNMRPFLTLAKSFGRLIIGILVLLPFYIFSKSKRLMGFFKISYSIGVFQFYFGKKNTFYK